jgi:hypothetical protein
MGEAVSYTSCLIPVPRAGLRFLPLFYFLLGCLYIAFSYNRCIVNNKIPKRKSSGGHDYSSTRAGGKKWTLVKAKRRKNLEPEEQKGMPQRKGMPLFCIKTPYCKADIRIIMSGRE